MPRKSAASKKSKKAKRNRCQATLLTDSLSTNQDDLLLMAELAQAEDTVAEENYTPNLEPEENMGVEAADAEVIPERTPEQSTEFRTPEPSTELTEDPRNLDSSCSSYDDCEAEDYSLNLEEGHGVNILKVVGQDSSGQQFALDSEALAGMLARPGVADQPVVVLSVAGAFRGGKSFLLGYLLRYLYAGGEEDWLGDARSPLAGFSWRGGCARDTSGLVLWSQPVPVALPSGERALVLLMDTQGAFDEHSTLRDSSLVFALSTLLASVQVYNVSRRLDENALQHLQLFTEYAALGGAGLAALTLLVRDWSTPYEYPYGAEGGARYLRDKLRVTEQQPEELREVRRRLAASFESVGCFLLPHPGRAADTDPTFRGEHGQLDEEFKAGLRELAPWLLAPARLRVKRVGGRALRARDLAALLQVYLEELGAAPTPLNVFTATARAHWLTAAAAARAALQAAEPARALPRAALAARLAAAIQAALEPLAPLAARANDEKGLDDLRQELAAQAARHAEENERRLELALARAADAFSTAVRALEDPQLCVAPRALPAALQRARARAAASLERAVDGADELPERAALLQELEARSLSLLQRLGAVNRANNEAAVAAALAAARAALQRCRPARPCAHPADLAAAHRAARAAALDAFHSARGSPAEPDEEDEYKAELEQKIAACLRNHENLNDRNNRAAIVAALHFYDRSFNLNRGCWHPDQLSNEHVQFQKLAIEYFCERRQGENSRESDVFLKEIEAKLSERYNDLCEENEQLNKAAVDGAYSVFIKTMDKSCKGLKMSDEDLSQKIYDAIHKAKLDFFGKRAESFPGEDSYLKLLQERVRAKVNHYCEKNGSLLSAGELVGAVATVGLVGGGLAAGGTWLALAAGRAGTAAAVSAVAMVLGAFKK